MSIQRFKANPDILTPDSEGDYVKYSDMLKLIVHADELSYFLDDAISVLDEDEDDNYFDMHRAASTRYDTIRIEIAGQQTIELIGTDEEETE